MRPRQGQHVHERGSRRCRRRRCSQRARSGLDTYVVLVLAQSTTMAGELTLREVFQRRESISHCRSREYQGVVRLFSQLGSGSGESRESVSVQTGSLDGEILPRRRSASLYAARLARLQLHFQTPSPAPGSCPASICAVSDLYLKCSGGGTDCNGSAYNLISWTTRNPHRTLCYRLDAKRDTGSCTLRN